MITEHAHEGLIDIEIFEKAAEIHQRIQKETEKKKSHIEGYPIEENMFDNVLYCGVCGRKMTRSSHVKYGMDGTKIRKEGYFCWNSTSMKTKDCPNSNHISKRKLMDILFVLIEKEFSMNLRKQKIYLEKGREYIQQAKLKLERECQRVEHKLAALKEEESQTYLNYRMGVLSQKEYVSYKMKKEEQLQELETKKLDLTKRQKQFQRDSEEYEKVVRSLLKWKKEKELTKELIETLIEKMYLYPDKRVEVVFSYTNPLNDLYSKDISMKMKASFQNKCEKGEYVFGQIPLGYEKSKERKHEIVVNEREAEIIRFIFALASSGISSTQIARKLYEEKIPTAMQIRHPEREMKKNLTWDANMVRRILNHRFYLGEMVYGKSKRERVGSKKGIAVPKQEWNILSNHHEPLVTPEVFAQVSSFQPEKSTKRKGKKHPLIGKIFCGGCGYSLNYKKTSNGKKPRYFWCRKHAILQIADCCTYFNAAILEEMILLMLNQELIKRGNIEKEEKYLEEYQKTQRKVLKKRKEEKKKQDSHVWEERKKLYESYRLGEMTAEEYRNRADELKEKISFLEEDIQETEKEYEQRKEEYHQKKQNMKQIIRFLPMKEKIRPNYF